MSAPLLKAIVHVHTHWSPDSRMRLEVLTQRCLEHGVDTVAVTDHNEIGGALELVRTAPFQVIVGEEILTREGGEIIGIFLKERVPPRLSAHETIAAIRAQEGLVVLPHPFDRIRRKRFPDSLLETIAPAVDIVETWNARNITRSADSAAGAYAERHGKITWAGADAHLPLEIGRTVMFLSPFETPAEFLSSLRNAQREEVRNPRWASWLSPWYRLTARHQAAA